METGNGRPRIGLNALLYTREQTYRSAGVSHYIGGLLSALPAADPQADYVAFSADPHLVCAGWQVVHTPISGAKPWQRIAWEQLAQPRALRRAKIDLIHAPVYVGPLHSPCPVVVTIHDLSHYLYPELFPPLKRLYLQTMTRITAQRAAAVICDSENTRRDVLHLLHIDAERVHTIHIGVDPEMQPLPVDTIARFKKERGLPEHYILFVGTLEPRKNIPTLIKAYAAMCAQSANPPYLVIGGGQGWYYQDIQRQVEQHELRDRVLFPGFIPQAELPLWYNGAAFFVYPSLYEGFGIPPLEAMACGTPVIVSQSSSLPEVVGDSGLLVDASEPENLTEAMCALWNEPERHAELRRRGLARAAAFAWQRTARETAAIYHFVLTSDAGR